MGNELLFKLSQRIRELRKVQKISQEKFSEKAELHPTYFAQIERAEVNPTIKVLYRIANALGMSISELLSFPDMEKLTTNKELLISKIIGLVKGKDEKTIQMIGKILTDVLKWIEDIEKSVQ